MAEPDHQTALEEFFQWETKSRVEIVDDATADERAYFVPLDSLKSYFKAEESKTLTRIISEVFDATDFPPIDPEDILRSHTAVFCILLHLGRGQCVEDFISYEELSDSRLPFDPKHPPAEFSFDDEGPNFLQQFCEKQWMYCVATFDRHMLHKHFGRQRLLPITCKEPLRHEGIAERSVIELYGPHNKLVIPSKDNASSNLNSNTFELKRYPLPDGESLYREEVNGFRSVKQEDSIRRFYGSFIHGDHFNLLLQFPDKGSLEEYFRKETPPSRGQDIISFWEGLFQLIKGLKTIHSVRGSHQNINPDSVVVISNGASATSDYQLKFADFGKGDANMNEGQDVSIYGSPESFVSLADGEESRAPWEADIWSLGCLYSEAAMWIADGYKGLLDYREQRTSETERISFQGGSCFHDGKRVLGSVLEAHRDIEDRLRRSDYITKDVLDSMIDEMLWEEDRPNAKALWRKVEMVLQRARQKLPSDEVPRPTSRQNRRVARPRLKPPTQPLPPVPPIPPMSRQRPGLTPIVERNYPPNVENWRAQVPGLHPRSYSTPAGSRSNMSSPISELQQTSSTESMSDVDRELADSIANWQPGDRGTSSSPITPFASPHTGSQYDFSKTRHSEQSLALHTKASYEFKKPPSLSRGLSYTSQHEVMDKLSNSSPLSAHPAFTKHDANASISTEGWDLPTVVSHPSTTSNPRVIVDPPNPRISTQISSHSRDESTSRHSVAFSTSHSIPSNHSSNHSSHKSHSDDTHVPARSPRRFGGFGIFPSKTREESAIPPIADKPPSYNDAASVRPMSALSSSTALGPRSATSPSAFSDIIEYYLPINTCIEWKKAHKKVKKHSKVPPLPGANMLTGLKDRDHVFIVDDSASMASLWPDVVSVFETISYIVKGMSPQGTELYFTISYDTWRRKDTSDLVAYVEKKHCLGECDISYRLNLELQAHRMRLENSKNPKDKKHGVRPKSIYILTNGEWGKGPDPRKCIGDMAEFLAKKGLQGHMAIEFISFARGAEGAAKVGDLAGTGFAVDIVDSTPWTGNVLKMFRGATDKHLFLQEELNELA